MSDIHFMQKAIDEALQNVLSNHGGPFGAIVVKDGKIIGIGRNEVTASNDPTAHAEVQAIRNACKYLNDFQLTDCEIYTSCEPCPMCIGAIYWARPKAVYYACTKQDAAKIGFDDQFIYEQLELPVEHRKIPMKQIFTDKGDLPFRTWEGTNNKVEY
ncbi:nucleoside deaminase [Neobacillus niacini]|uniref:nucleoside deaminase n=1 Tax=Neobacillus niacini TaxID=86668 RepID=UPI00203C398E|nr:nucleoside deaminase [Neobacillus niacini]MCM3693753.1 nucleoside deaminase [Neobacillus niacini]